MRESKHIVIHPDRATLEHEAGASLLGVLSLAIRARGVAHAVLTGGSVGIGLLRAAREADAAGDVDWSRVHVWWGDDRFVPAADGERNALQAREALLNHVPIPAEHIHELPASDAGLPLDDAAAAAGRELLDAGVAFDITLLGMGPDAHVASLFPGAEGPRVTAHGVIPVRHSPKPPPERLSMTFATLNSSARVWLVVAGEDKASALALALTSADKHEVPAAGVHGLVETLYLVDRAAASRLPDHLIPED